MQIHGIFSFYTQDNNVYFLDVCLALSNLYQWTRNIDLNTFLEDFKRGENYSFQVLRNKITIFGIIFYFDLNSFQLSWIYFLISFLIIVFCFYWEMLSLPLFIHDVLLQCYYVWRVKTLKNYLFISNGFSVNC